MGGPRHAGLNVEERNHDAKPRAPVEENYSNTREIFPEKVIRRSDFCGWRVSVGWFRGFVGTLIAAQSHANCPRMITSMLSLY